MLRAARNAVRTRRTRNKVLRAVNFAYFLYCRALFFVKRLKVFHKRQIVAHLIQIAHARQNHEDAVKTSGEANGITCTTAALQIIQNLVCAAGQIDQVTALDGFHHYYGLVVLAAYFIAKPRLNGWILVIDIVKLNLYEFDLRMFGKYHIQHVGTVVEGKSEMPYLALLL